MFGNKKRWLSSVEYVLTIYERLLLQVFIKLNFY